MIQDGWRPLTILTALAVAVLCAEVFLLFVNRDGVFAIEGDDDYDIVEFGSGAVVAHAFLMRGDGLHSVRVRLNSDTPAAANIRWVLWNGTPETPSQMARAFDGVASVKVIPGRKWHSISFLRNGSSNDKWFTIELQLMDPVPGRESSGRSPQVSVVASRNNPSRGGVLWVDGARQSGSLFLRADATGRTLYRRFQAEAVPHFPRVLQAPVVQWTTFALLHWAFLVFAYSVIKDAESSR